MSTKQDFYLNNTKINPPKNWQELEIQLNFDRDKAEADESVSITDPEFVRENADTILKYVQDGLTTGPGVFEGIPYRIELERDGVLEVPFDGYIDLIKNGKFSPNSVITNAVEAQKLDWLNDVADGFTFEYLYKEVGSITNDDFVPIPYIISTVPNYTDAAVGVLAVYVMAKELKDAIQRIAEFIPELAIFYVFSTYIKLILYIIYLIILIIALVKLIKNVILLIIQPVKYHASMYIVDQLRKGCEYLGLQFKAPDFDEGGRFNKAVIMPEKYYNPINAKEKQILGFTEPSIDQTGYFKGTFGDLVRVAKQMINGKIILEDGVLSIVRRDAEIGSAQYQLPPIDLEYDGKAPRYYSLNTNEFSSNTLISFQTDLSEKNTIQQYLGTSYQIIVSPQRINNQNFVLMKGLREVRIPLALGKRKESLTTVEAVLDAFLKAFGAILGALVKAVNAVITVLNKIIALVNSVLKKLATIGIKVKFQLPSIPKFKTPNFQNTFSNRIGMLLLESDLMNQPKVMLIDQSSNAKNTKISTSNASELSAKTLYEGYYYVDSFVPTNDRPNANQYLIYQGIKTFFSFDDFLKVKRNNSILVSDGREAVIDSLKWNPWEQQATIDLRISQLYTNNLRTTILEPDGS